MKLIHGLICSTITSLLRQHRGPSMLHMNLWTVKNEGYLIEIPEDKIEINFCRSSGPGGQNVNKLNTKAEIRFNVEDAIWLPDEVRERLKSQQASKISKDGDLIITSQEHRTQPRNKVDCFDKLKVMVEEACVEPKERNMYTEISEKGKRIRKDEKKRRSATKETRRSRPDYD